MEAWVEIKKSELEESSSTRCNIKQRTNGIHINFLKHVQSNSLLAIILLKIGVLSRAVRVTMSKGLSCATLALGFGEVMKEATESDEKKVMDEIKEPQQPQVLPRSDVNMCAVMFFPSSASLFEELERQLAVLSVPSPMVAGPLHRKQNLPYTTLMYAPNGLKNP